MEEPLPVLLITLSAIFQYCKSQVITNFITICEPLYFQWNQSCGDLSDKSDDGIAIYITFNDISHAMMAEKPAKKFAACSEFLLCFIYFLISHAYCGCTELASSITMQHNSWYGMILLEKQMKGATKLTWTLWIHENHVCELWREELNEGWSSSAENHADSSMSNSLAPCKF